MATVLWYLFVLATFLATVLIDYSIFYYIESYYSYIYVLVNLLYKAEKLSVRLSAFLPYISYSVNTICCA